MLIFRYLFREVCGSFLAVTIVLSLIFLSGRFVRYLADAAAGQFTGNLVFSIMLYRLPGFMELILPLALFLGIMLSYGRLYVESEMVILQACGVSKRQMLMYTLGPALLVMLLVASLTLYLTPVGWKKFHEIWANPDNYSGLGTLVAGNFKRLGADGSVIYTGELNSRKTRLGDVFIARSDAENPEKLTLVKARQGEVINKGTQYRYIELYDGVEITGEMGHSAYDVTRFDTYGQLLTERKKTYTEVDSIDALSMQALAQKQDTKAQALYQWRISLPVLVPVIALIALALSETSHRRGRYIKMLPGLIIYIMYVTILVAARSAIERGTLPAAIGLWPVHAMFLLLGIMLLYAPEFRRTIAYWRHGRA